MKPNLLSFVPGQGVEEVMVTRDVPGYGVNLAMSFAEEPLRGGHALRQAKNERSGQTLCHPFP
jgi:hypothetical protein